MKKHGEVCLNVISKCFQVLVPVVWKSFIGHDDTSHVLGSLVDGDLAHVAARRVAAREHPVVRAEEEVLRVHVLKRRTYLRAL